MFTIKYATAINLFLTTQLTENFINVYVANFKSSITAGKIKISVLFPFAIRITRVFGHNNTYSYKLAA